MGGLADAVRYASEQAGLEDPDVYLLPEPKGGLDGLFGAPQKGDPNGEFIGAPQRANPVAVGVASRLEASGLFGLLDPWKQRSIAQSLEMLQATKDGAVMLIGAPVDVRLD